MAPQMAAYNSAVEEFIDDEYPMLQGKTYLDHGGATVYAKSLIHTVATDLISNLYGNPHSASDPAHLSGQVVEETREKTLRFFGADPEYFDLVFVANATAAIKLVMESFKDIGNETRSADGQEGGFRYLYHVDSHNSIVGVREATEGNHYCFRNDMEVEEWLSGKGNQCSYNKRLALFGYPGQSNMTGRRLPRDWPSKIRNSPHETHRDTYTLLDAAALASTYPLNSVFSNPDTAPDFTALSFYKIFGYPDLGALIVRKASGNILRWGRRYFGGGTVEVVAVLGNKPWFESRKELHCSLEDGTLPFHNIIALNAAIDVHRRLYGPNAMSTISSHTSFLAERLYHGMSTLVHSTGVPLCRIYTNGENNYGNSTLQGATIAFNVFTSKGHCIPYTGVVETLANKRKIYIRAGTLCNPGGIATHLGFNDWHIKRLWADGHRCGSAGETGTEIVNGKPTGVVRVSLGAMTTMANIDTMIKFLREEFIDPVTAQLEALRLPVRQLTPNPTPTWKEEASFRERSRRRPTREWMDSEETLHDSRPPTPASIQKLHNFPAGNASGHQLDLMYQTRQRSVSPFPFPAPTDFDELLKRQQTHERSQSCANSITTIEVERSGLKKLWKPRTRKQSVVI